MLNYIAQKNTYFLTMLFLVCLLIPLETIAQETREINVAPDNEKHSSIHELDACVMISENMTIKETWEAAWVEAKRQALEMARTYITSKTKVKNFEVKYDLVWSQAEGAVTLLDKKDFGIENNSRYHAWVKADVEYELKPKTDSQLEQDMDSRLPLNVKVWSTKKAYKQDENIEIFIKGNRDFHARVVNITSTGDIIQLLPNQYRNDHFFRAGTVYKIPDKGDAFDLKVAPPYGKDTVVVYASEVPLGHVNLEPPVQGLSRYRGTRGALATQSRGINVVSKNNEGISGAEFYEASWSLRTGQ